MTCMPLNAMWFSSMQNGAVINLSSLSAIQVNPDSFAYNIAKAAMDHLTKTQARKYTKLGVRVNSVNPGYVRTLASLPLCMTLQTLFVFLLYYF